MLGIGVDAQLELRRTGASHQITTQAGAAHCRNPRRSISPLTCRFSIPIISGACRARGSAIRITARPSSTRTSPASPSAASWICCSSATPAARRRISAATTTAVVRYGAKWPRHDMTPMIPLMAKAAQGVGFALTMSTTYHHPFHCARVFNALDHVTRGRIAWNAVTSAYKNEAANYGFDVMMDHDERYERAQEFLEVACALWDSVEPDALVLDREKGIYADPAKVHRIDFRGRYFNVRGPLPGAAFAAAPAGDHPGRPLGSRHDARGDLRGPPVQHAAYAAEHAAASQGTRRQARIGRPQAARHRHSLVDPHPGGGVRDRRAGEERRYLESIPPEAGPGGDVRAVRCRFLDRDARHAAR